MRRSVFIKAAPLLLLALLPVQRAEPRVSPSESLRQSQQMAREAQDRARVFEALDAVRKLEEDVHHLMRDYQSRRGDVERVLRGFTARKYGPPPLEEPVGPDPIDIEVIDHYALDYAKDRLGAGNLDVGRGRMNVHASLLFYWEAYGKRLRAQEQGQSQG